jgi:FkbM family methyltransferase
MKTYVQVGANIGADDFQREIELLVDPSLIVLVEPNYTLLDELKENYKDISNRHEVIICNKAISTKNNTEKLYLYPESGHSSLIKRRSHIAPVGEMDVELITFSDLCRTYNISEIELLQIDTEGLDYEIVNSINFEEIKINALIFEFWDYFEDDLNSVYTTGQEFLNQINQGKLEKLYDWSRIRDQRDYKLILKK